MGLRFQKRIKLFPGIVLNINKASLSITVGVKGFHVTAGTRGVGWTLSLPGTGLSYSRKLTK